jgi:hypothetical protein
LIDRKGCLKSGVAFFLLFFVTSSLWRYDFGKNLNEYVQDLFKRAIVFSEGHKILREDIYYEAVKDEKFLKNIKLN